MKIRTYILSGVAAALLATSVGTATTGTVEAAGKSKAVVDGTHVDNAVKRELETLLKELNVNVLSTAGLDPYFKRTVLQYGNKAKYALKNGNFIKMSTAKNELEKIYEEIKQALEEDREARYGY